MSGRAPGMWRRRRVAMAAGVGAVALRVLGLTWRVRWTGARLPTSEAVLAMWHGELLPLVWALRGKAIAPLVSTHSDGELIARIIASLGYVPIRGSSSRGGARALIEAVRRIREGTVVAFTTDGPRGPRRQSAPGAVAAAVRGGVPVVPVGAVVSSAWQLRSWDRFVIPKPFARVTIRVGASLVASATSPRALDQALHAVCQPDSRHDP